MDAALLPAPPSSPAELLQLALACRQRPQLHRLLLLAPAAPFTRLAVLDEADLLLALRAAAALLAAASEHAPAELARRVASPGGVTQVGMDVLDADRRLARLMEDTLRGARDRSAEMTAQARANL